ncbi:hypothetical protein K3495_g10539 [Podosphaera aphanis]|nr:hypothetical protein K3495_g10539 [Podosphaera aphanis]
MSLKQEIETWVAALAHYDNNQFEESLNEFEAILDTSKIYFNCGVIHATLGNHERAVEMYQRAVSLDQYLAVAYFQQGVSNFLINDFAEALANFNDTLLYLRGNNMIDYSQLGLTFKLYSCEVLFNRGLCYMNLNQREAGFQDFSYAVKEKVVEDHNVIDEAIQEEAEGYTVFSIPVGVVYRPDKAKVKNLKTKDYLGKATLVAASDRANAFTGFTGSEIKNASKADVKDDRPTENLSFAATNLVKPGLSSKRPDGSISNGFPPTPPPEGEKSSNSVSRAASVKNGPRQMLPRLSTVKGRQNDRYDDQSPQQRPLQRSNTEQYRSGSGKQPYMRDNGGLRPNPRIELEDNPSPSELYDMYSSRPFPGRQQRPRQMEEDEDYASGYDEDSFDEGDFEMVSRKPSRGSRALSSTGSQRQSRRPEIRNVRIKVHSEDVRYVMVGIAIEFPDLVDRIREKFGLRQRFKIQVREDDRPDGDMITMGDQDDLDMAIMATKSTAARERLDIGKMEVWISEI